MVNFDFMVTLSGQGLWTLSRPLSGLSFIHN